MRVMLPIAATVPQGAFQSLLFCRKAPIDFVSDGVAVHVEARPCAAPLARGLDIRGSSASEQRLSRFRPAPRLPQYNPPNAIIRCDRVK
ncbi:hypothetical protein [Sphingomonas sp. Marseille-Q8236]